MLYYDDRCPYHLPFRPDHIGHRADDISLYSSLELQWPRLLFGCVSFSDSAQSLELLLIRITITLLISCIYLFFVFLFFYLGLLPSSLLRIRDLQFLLRHSHPRLFYCAINKRGTIMEIICDCKCLRNRNLALLASLGGGKRQYRTYVHVSRDSNSLPLCMC